MARAACRSALPLLWLLASGGAGAQEQELPPGAQLKIIEIVFRVESLGFKVESFGGQVLDLQVKETETEVRIELAADVLFEFDKASLLPKAEDTLNQAAEFIRQRAAGVVRIEGHTDAKGDAAYNQGLSERRAASVQQWFARKGLADLRFSSRGFGETRPIAPNAKPDGADDPEGRQKNRRVEIVISKKPLR
jgi:outer membrane protein OmpA-like peptidoglycan-associated protein